MFKQMWTRKELEDIAKSIGGGSSKKYVNYDLVLKYGETSPYATFSNSNGYCKISNLDFTSIPAEYNCITLHTEGFSNEDQFILHSVGSSSNAENLNKRLGNVRKLIVPYVQSFDNSRFFENWKLDEFETYGLLPLYNGLFEKLGANTKIKCLGVPSTVKGNYMFNDANLTNIDDILNTITVLQEDNSNLNLFSKSTLNGKALQNVQEIKNRDVSSGSVSASRCIFNETNFIGDVVFKYNSGLNTTSDVEDITNRRVYGPFASSNFTTGDVYVNYFWYLCNGCFTLSNLKRLYLGSVKSMTSTDREDSNPFYMCEDLELIAFVDEGTLQFFTEQYEAHTTWDQTLLTKCRVMTDEERNKFYSYMN